MVTVNELKKQSQKIAKLERTLALQKIKQRKQDTRRKIELGGLVIKAKMDKYSKSVILGALIEAMENLKSDTNYKTLLQTKGEAAFMEFTDPEILG